MADSLTKKLEIFLRKHINNFLNFKGNQVYCHKPGSAFKFGEIRKILLLRQDRIGDVLVSTPTIRALRNKLTNTRIDILLGDKNFNISSAVEPYVNNIYRHKKKFLGFVKLIKFLRQEKYDLIIDMFDNPSATSTIIIKFSNPRYSLGIEKENKRVYSHLTPLLQKSSTHIVRRIANLLMPFGINPDTEDLSLEYHLSEKEKKSSEINLPKKNKAIRLGLNLSGSSDEKYWGIENNINFINKINEKYKNIEIILFYTENLRDDMNKILKNANAIAAPITESIRDYAIGLSTCDIIVTPDTSAVHFAAAWKIPCLAMFELSDERYGMPWLPYNSPNKIILTREGTLKSISVEVALAVFGELYKVSF